MDSFDHAFYWTLAGLPVAAMVLWYIFRARYNELVALHLAVFWAQFFAYGAVWLYGQPSFRFPASAMWMLGFELTIYCVAMLALSTRWRDRVRDISEAALTIRPAILFFWMALSISMSVYIVAVYGFASLIPHAQIAETAGLPAWLNYLNRFLMLPGWGATYCCAVRFAYRRYHPVQLMALAFVLARMVFETGEGKRFFLIVCLVAALFGPRRPFRVKHMLIKGAAAALLIVAVWAYYEGMRKNFYGTMTSGRQYESTAEMVGAVILPSEQSASLEGMAMAQFQLREPPIRLLLIVFELPDLAHGAFVSQVAQNLLPSMLVNKNYRHENEVLSETFEFPYNDYPWTLLSEMQAEISAFAALVAPVIYFGLFWLYWSIVARWKGHSSMILVATIGAAIYSAGEVQTDLTVQLSQLRTLLIYLAIGFMLFHLCQIAYFLLRQQPLPGIQINRATRRSSASL